MSTPTGRPVKTGSPAQRQQHDEYTVELDLPWIEKYRPMKLHEIQHQPAVVRILQALVEDVPTRNELPHLLFCGPPGNGKTSAALALARHLYGPSLSPTFRQNVLELNASWERGIQTIRSRLKTFSRQAVARRGPSDVSFKLIILDEMDAFTIPAQQALRRLMEVYAPITRFVLICNDSSRLVDALLSRCLLLRFAPLSDVHILPHLHRIHDREQIVSRVLGQPESKQSNTSSKDPPSLSVALDAQLPLLARVVDGDLRQAINLFQGLVTCMGDDTGDAHGAQDAQGAPPLPDPSSVDRHDRPSIRASRAMKSETTEYKGVSLRAGRATDAPSPIDKELEPVGSPVDPVHNSTLLEIIAPHCPLSQEQWATLWSSIESSDTDRLQSVAANYVADGRPLDLLFDEWVRATLDHPEWSDSQKADVCLRVAQATTAVALGASEYLQLLDVLSYCSRL